MSEQVRRGLRLAVAAVFTVMALVLGACSGSEPSSGQPGPGQTTTTATARPVVDPQPCDDTACPPLPVGDDDAIGDSGVDGGGTEAVTAYLDRVLDDLERRWDGWSEGLDWGSFTAGRVLVEPGEQFASDCIFSEDDEEQIIIAADTPNAIFCGVDVAADGEGLEREGSVVLPVLTFADIWEGQLLGRPSNFLGDFTAAIIVAHEYGHNVVQRSAEVWDVGRPVGDNNELIADCLAGTWAATVFERSDLSPTDIVQAVALMTNIADAEPGQGHGTGPQRIAALSRGFAGRFEGQGHPVTCFQAYWPELIEAQQA